MQIIIIERTYSNIYIYIVEEVQLFPLKIIKNKNYYPIKNIIVRLV